jgi:hypothetical protein
MSRFKTAFLILLPVIGFLSMTFKSSTSEYNNLNNNRLADFQTEQQTLITLIEDQKDIYVVKSK